MLSFISGKPTPSGRDRQDDDLTYLGATDQLGTTDHIPLLRRGRTQFFCGYLWLRVHLDAFLLDPLGYLQAARWRIRGLKVRSRNRIAALAGRSPFAYRFWIARREHQIRAQVSAPQCSKLPAVVAAIDITSGEEGIEATLASLPSGMQPITIGGQVADIRWVQEPAALAAYLPADEAWICPLSPGDRLAGAALAIYADAIAGAPAARILYSDDDLLDESGKRTQPHLKPGWNPELFEHHDFITGSSLVKSDREEVRALPSYHWAQALVRQALEHSESPKHVPHVLHHRRSRPTPIMPARIRPFTAIEPQITVVIPTRNRADLLRKAVEGVNRTDYPNLSLMIVDNGSDETEALSLIQDLRDQGTTVLSVPGPFNFSALNNFAVGQGDSELLCFLNNDVEVLEGDWLRVLARQAVRPEIGAVGARLIYPDGTIQHAGVFTGIGGGAGHGHRFQRLSDFGYFARAHLPQRVSAVTAACMVVSREKFLNVGGFDEENFPVAFNDVDLCLRLNERGWQSFYEPRATLIHHESKSRGSDSDKANRKRFEGELAALKLRWLTDQKVDPYHHPHLSRFCEQFIIGI